ncbi:MAG: carboxypeptidase-like regulatory domain-containing protein [Solirubrobacteraceae bacterium]|nr:carboxypeptidase-like regulatory domain-containing protein [Solirubrobacteraceae bacterium]
MVAVALVTALALSAPAAGATYDVPYCTSPALHDWQPENRGDFGLPGDTPYNKCSSSPGSHIGISWQAGSRPTNTRQAYVLRPPVDSNLRIVRWDATASTSVGGAGLRGLLTGVKGTMSQLQCGFDSGCRTATLGGVLPSEPTRLEPPNYPKFHELTMELDCFMTNMSSCTSAAAINVTRNIVTWDDRDAPQSLGPPTGPLATSFDAPARGAMPVSAAVRDIGSGVRRVVFVAGRTTLGASPEGCKPPYQRAQPCPTTTQAMFPADTTRVADGVHDARLYAEDAAGTQRPLWSGKLWVRNGDRVGSGVDPQLRGAPNGSPSADDAVVKLWWPATERKPSKKKAVKQRCKKASYARRHRLACKGRPASSKITANYARRRVHKLRGRVRTPDGHPIANAVVDVSRLASATGARAEMIAQPVTNAQGRWSVRVPVDRGSARITAAYRPRERDNDPRTALASLRVRAATTLTAPRRTKMRARFTVAGRLLGTQGAPRTTSVAVQVLYRGRWSTIGTTRANKNGRWTVRYRWPAGVRGSGKLRATVRPAATWPYETRTTTARRIRVG